MAAFKLTAQRVETELAQERLKRRTETAVLRRQLQATQDKYGTLRRQLLEQVTQLQHELQQTKSKLAASRLREAQAAIHNQALAVGAAGGYGAPHVDMSVARHVADVGDRGGDDGAATGTGTGGRGGDWRPNRLVVSASASAVGARVAALEAAKNEAQQRAVGLKQKIESLRRKMVKQDAELLHLRSVHEAKTFLCAVCLQAKPAEDGRLIASKS